MNVLLIKDGKVENCICADSIERAQQFYPDHLCLERTDEMRVGPGWGYVDGSFVEPPAPPPVPEDRRITQLAFLNRFTDAEAIAVDLASQGATVQAAAMRRYQAKVNAATFIDLSRDDTRSGVESLETAGLLAAGRAAEILDGPISEIERYRGTV